MKEKHIKYLGKEIPDDTAETLRHRFHQESQEALGSIEDAGWFTKHTIEEHIKDSGMF